MVTTESALGTLKSVFGFDGFRDGQESAIAGLLDGRPVLAIFPTGAGKSLCYQLPALLLDGLTLVISPLIALMKDQIDFLESRNIPAARLDSSLDAAAVRETHRRLRDGELKILFVAPERLANERFLATLSRLDISLVAIDEAHCISEWGHNFRPDYLKLAPLARRLGIRRVLGLTATATPPVARQIAAAFDITDADIVRTGFYRPNLALMVTPVSEAERARLLVERITRRDRGSAIVYVTLQKTAETIAGHLNANGIEAVAYHAGMDSEERHAVQDRFMESRDLVVVATIAFGMGIDKSDIRAVYHYNFPKSLENYAQEIGRSGRDGQPSVCEMLACADDLTTLENFNYGDTPTPDAVSGLLREVLSHAEPFDVSIYELSSTHDMRPLVVETLLTYLELDGILASTGPFYSEYKYQPARPMEEILAGFDEARSSFLRRVFAKAHKGKTWFTIDLHGAALALGEPRERLVKAFGYLEEHGDLILKPSGARQGYRPLKRSGDTAFLAKAMNARFADRESRDIERLGEVVAFASYQGCKTRRLLDYFGEPMDHDCGHCGWCKGHRPGPIATPTHRRIGQREHQLIAELRAERHDALASPRQLARFLCGIHSPKASREKLPKDPRFGALASVPFREVLALA